jgi:hypothetical protein
MITLSGKVVAISHKKKKDGGQFQIVQVLTNGNPRQLIDLTDFDNAYQGKVGENIDSLPIRVTSSRYGVKYQFDHNGAK